jgi:hypothetical protein
MAAAERAEQLEKSAVDGRTAPAAEVFRRAAQLGGPHLPPDLFSDRTPRIPASTARVTGSDYAGVGLTDHERASLPPPRPMGTDPATWDAMKPHQRVKEEKRLAAEIEIKAKRELAREREDASRGGRPLNARALSPAAWAVYCRERGIDTNGFQPYRQI